MVFSVRQRPSLSRGVLNWIVGDPTVGISVRRQDDIQYHYGHYGHLLRDPLYNPTSSEVCTLSLYPLDHLGICVSLQSRLFWEGLTISDLGIVPVQTVRDLHDLPKIRGFRGHPTKGGSRRPP